jgi:hypothetical protein
MLERLQTHLRSLVLDSNIDVWDDTKIRPGSSWPDEICKALQTAKVAILLVSADFLASDFIRDSELTPLLAAAKEEGVIILPVIIGHCRFAQSKIAQFQAVNDPSTPLSDLTVTKRDKVFVISASTCMSYLILHRRFRDVIRSLINHGILIKMIILPMALSFLFVMISFLLDKVGPEIDQWRGFLAALGLRLGLFFGLVLTMLAMPAEVGNPVRNRI